MTVTAPDQKPRPRTARREQTRPTRAASRARPSPVTRPATAAAGIATAAPPSPGRGDVSSSVTALPAATTVLDSATISRMPVTTYGDLFRSLPGFNVSNYGQGGIGYGLSLRGYTEAEHGRDIAYYIDGVPLNEVSSIHTPNYADLNILLPETIKSIEIIRGPFSVEYGDSNLGGAVIVTTKDSEPFGSVGISGGTQGTVRGVATYSSTGGDVQPYLALEGYHTDGYRQNSFVDRYNSFNRVTMALPDGATLSIRAQAYGTDFGAPGFANLDAIKAGIISERSATNITDGGNKQLENLVVNYSSGPTDQELKGTLYVSHDYFNRYSDFGGGQRWQHDDRTMTGGRVTKVFTGAIGDGIPVQLLVGSNWRTDFINAFQYPTTARAISGPAKIDVGLTETNIAAFSQLQIKPTPWLKFTAGGRFDQFFYDIDDHLNPGSTPNISPGVTSPKVGVAITPLKGMELFANYGEGFRSIDVPLELLGNPTIQPFKITSTEGGVQFNWKRFRFLADYWTTESQNEAFQAAPGLPVNLLGRARREGFDLDGRMTVLGEANNRLDLFANYTGVTARLLDAAPSYYVPNVPNYVANVGVEAAVATHNGQSLTGTAYVTFVGKKNLTQDGLLTTHPYSRVTGKVAYNWPEGWTAFSQAVWYPGDRYSELAINLGDPVGASSSDIYVAPQPTLVVLAGLTYRFPTTFASASPGMVIK